MRDASTAPVNSVPVTEEISEVETTSPLTITTTVSTTTTTVEPIQIAASTSTSTASSTTTTTGDPVWVPYVFVFKAKPSEEFLANLPPAQSVVSIPPTHYDPVRVS